VSVTGTHMETVAHSAQLAAVVTVTS